METPTILVCDDEADIVSALRIYLEAEGYRVLTAANGKEAVAIVSRESVQLVVMGIMMPVMDGLSAARAIRSMERKDATVIPIIAMTANAFDEDRRRSREAGMDRHLAKPLDPQEIIRTINECVKSR